MGREVVAEEKYVEGDEEQGMEMNRSRKELMEGLPQLDISVMGTWICELVCILGLDKTHMAEKWLTTTLRALISLANSPTSSGVECPLL